ncbi:hypothetical protein [Actinophytocola sp.]|uniref:hypothetical protein n=1 Tax=Actinophytocola sp. TaxID=1872138 RepID=UPI002ED46181
MKHVVTLMAVAAFALVPTATSAAAAPTEGGFSSYLRGVKAGFNSRTWTDQNSDAVNTAIHLRYCVIDEDSSITPELVVRLWRERFGPDQKVGTDKLYRCAGRGERKSWGRVPSGKYHFEVRSVNGGDSLHVSTRANGVVVAF